MEVVAQLLGHAHRGHHAATYGHLTVEDARRVMEQAGWFTGRAGAAVTAPSLKPAGSSGLLGKLMAESRGEFRSDSWISSAEDLVFGGAECRVAGCARTARGRGMCQGHLQRWDKEGRPDLEGFVASTDPGGSGNDRTSAVQGARLRLRLAPRRHVRAARTTMGTRRTPRPGRVAGRTAADQATSRRARPAASRTAALAAGVVAVLPRPHQTWKTNGRPDIDEFADSFSRRVPRPRGDPVGSAGPQLALEIQYAMQCRHDDAHEQAAPHVVMQVVRFLATTTVNRCSTTTRTPGGRRSAGRTEGRHSRGPC